MELEFSYYQKALSYWQAKQKALETVFSRILSIDSCDATQCTLRFRDKLLAFYDLLQKPADFFITETEWRNLK